MDIESYRLGYRDGYKAAREDVIDFGQPLDKFQAMSKSIVAMPTKSAARATKRRSKKAKLLDKMTKPVWNKYKKGSGKKTYVQIRAQVSRSQKYKRAVKRL